MTNTKPKAPKHLKLATRRWWQGVVEEFSLEPHHVRLLTLAAEAWDRAQEARETIATVGAYFTDRFNCPRAHPAVGVERDSRIGFARLLRELDLDVEPPRAPGRPPGLGR
jgi:phage terminase small subunit